MNVQKPTKIIEKPVKGSGPSGTQLQISCDNGVTYTMTELATVIGVSDNTMFRRLKDLGWNHEEVLSPQLQRVRRRSFDFVDGGEAGDLAHMGNVERPHNMAKIPSVTPFERQMMREGVL